jgi:hypothetical protein
MLLITVVCRINERGRSVYRLFVVLRRDKDLVCSIRFCQAVVVYQVEIAYFVRTNLFFNEHYSWLGNREELMAEA